jgi:hypothetical protein
MRSRMDLHNRKLEFLKLYGNRCSCCGEIDPGFLTIAVYNCREGSIVNEMNQMNVAIRLYPCKNYGVLCYNCCNVTGRSLS